MRRSTTTARTGATAPPCNPATQRIGRHLYSIGTTRESLERSVRDRAEAIQQGAETDAKVDPEHAAHFAEHRLANAQGLATAALDIVDRSREAEPCRVNYIFTESEGPEPVPGQTLFRVPEWDWHVEVAQVLERKKGRDGSRVAEILEVVLHESEKSPVPPPHQLTFGFWGTWTSTSDLGMVPAAAAWMTMFELFGEPGKRSAHNDGLRDLLDARPSRHWVDRLSFHRIHRIEDFRTAATKLGRPDRWYTGEYGTPLH